jgi:peptide/nickel transport system substrate-binding protein
MAGPKLERRDLLRLAAAGAGATALTSLLAACGGTGTATTAPAPSTAASTAPSSAPSSAGVGASTAPASTAPSAAASAAPSVAASAAPSGAATASAAAGGASGGQISIYWTKPSTIHPLFSTAGIEQGVERQIFGALMRMNDKLTPVPDLAEKVEGSADAKVWTFTLKKDLKFSDGQPLTAKDVVFTFERAIDKRSGSYWSSRLSIIDGAADYAVQKADKIKGLETPDDYTIKMTLTAPDAVWTQTISDFAGLCILPSHVLKDTPPDQMAKAPFSFAPTPSAGAFAFSDWKADQYLEIKRNENYTGGAKAKLDKIFCKVLTQQDVGIAQLEKGELDLMVVPVTEAERLRKNANLTVTSTPAPSVSFLALNMDRPFFKDKRVRQAMMYALDREAMAKEILKGEATVVNSTIIGPDWMGTPEGLNAYKFDTNKAKQLLKEANWDPNQKVALMYTPGDKVNDALVPIMQQLYKEAGIALELFVTDSPEYTRRAVTGATAQAAGDFDIALVGEVFRDGRLHTRRVQLRPLHQSAVGRTLQAGSRDDRQRCAQEDLHRRRQDPQRGSPVDLPLVAELDPRLQ